MYRIFIILRNKKDFTFFCSKKLYFLEIVDFMIKLFFFRFPFYFRFFLLTFFFIFFSILAFFYDFFEMFLGVFGVLGFVDIFWIIFKVT